jgi:hypothetical protein
MDDEQVKFVSFDQADAEHRLAAAVALIQDYESATMRATEAMSLFARDASKVWALSEIDAPGNPLHGTSFYGVVTRYDNLSLNIDVKVGPIKDPAERKRVESEQRRLALRGPKRGRW